MALFISGLTFPGPLLIAAKIGVMAGSALSAAVGMALLIVSPPKPEPPSSR
jgi:Na+:H+ antiporter, NhaA family